MLSNDLEEMVAARDVLAELTPDASYLASMHLDIIVARKNWAEVEGYLNQTEDAKSAAIYSRKTSFKIDGVKEEVPSSLRRLIIEKIQGMPKLQVMDLPIIARLQWDLGEKEAALATAREAVEKGGPLRKEVLENYAAGFEAGEPLTFSGFQKALMSYHRAKRERKGTKE